MSFVLMKTAIFILLPVLQSTEVHLRAPCLSAEGDHTAPGYKWNCCCFMKKKMKW